MCKGRYVSDSVGKGKFPFYTQEGVSTYYYHVARYCTRPALDNSDLCEVCVEKEKNLLTCTISENNSLKNRPHPTVLHGRIDEPITCWSHIEGGIWFKKMIQKGYMKHKFIVDEKKVFTLLSTMEGTIPQKITKLMKEVPMTKASALNYIKISKQTNKILVVDPSVKEEAYDVVEVFVKKITIGGKEYYYESKKDKVYTLDYDYVGRYNRAQEKIHTEYPDSDAEPVF